MKRFQIWFYAAAAYNLLWGAAVELFPQYFSSLVGLHPAAETLPLVQVIGMMVGVYAIGYYLLARDPQRYCGFIWVGLAGKMFGPIGFAYSVATGLLPWSFGWVCVFNDLIWWPAFWIFALRYARRPLA